MYCGTRTDAVLGDPPEVVAPEIDEHHVLGPFLLVPLELLGQAQRLRRASAPRGSRSGNRVRLDVPALDPHQHLGRRPDDRELADTQEVHVRRAG